MQITVLTILATLLFPIQENTKYRYDPSGKILQKTEYRDGKKTGKEIFYYPDGRVKKEISWYDDVLDGYTVSYDSLTHEESGRAYYIFGLPDDVHVERINGISGSYSVNTDYRYGEIKSVTMISPSFHTYTPYTYINGRPVKNGREKTFLNGEPANVFYKDGRMNRTEILGQDGKQSGQISYTDEGIIKKRFYYTRTPEDGRCTYKTENYKGGILSSVVLHLEDGSEEHHVYENGEDTGIRRLYRSCELVEEKTPDGTKIFHPDDWIKNHSVLKENGWPMYHFTQITSTKQMINDKMIPIYRLKETDEILNGRYVFFRCPIYAEASYKDGIEHGVEAIYNREGILQTILVYEEGVKMSRADYHENGSISREYIYTDDYTTETNYSEDGTFITIKETNNQTKKATEKKYRNGELVFEGQYFRNSTRIGRFYDATGENIIISNHEVNVITDNHWEPYLQGPYEEYYSPGKIRLKGQYEKREKTGVWAYYHPDGTLEKEEEYVKNRVHTYRFFHPNNQPAIEFMLRGGWLEKEHLRYSEDGVLLYHRIQDEQDDEKMHETFYHPNGKVKAVYTIRNRMRTGDYTCYDKEGKIIESGEIENDEYIRRIFYDKEGNVVE